MRPDIIAAIALGITKSASRSDTNENILGLSPWMDKFLRDAGSDEASYRAVDDGSTFDRHFKSAAAEAPSMYDGMLGSLDRFVDRNMDAAPAVTSRQQLEKQKVNELVAALSGILPFGGALHGGLGGNRRTSVREGMGDLIGGVAGIPLGPLGAITGSAIGSVIGARQGNELVDKRLAEMDATKQASADELMMIKLGFGAFARPALSFAGKKVMTAAPRLFNWGKKMIGSGMQSAGNKFAPGGQMAQTGAKWVGDATGKLKNYTNTLQQFRHPAQQAFNALAPWQQSGLRGGRFAAMTASGMNVPGMMGHMALGYPAAMREGAGMAANQGADMMDQIADSGFMDRGQLALALAFNPDMLKQYSQQLRQMAQ